MHVQSKTSGEWVGQMRSASAVPRSSLEQYVVERYLDWMQHKGCAKEMEKLLAAWTVSWSETGNRINTEVLQLIQKQLTAFYRKKHSNDLLQRGTMLSSRNRMRIKFDFLTKHSTSIMFTSIIAEKRETNLTWNKKIYLTDKGLILCFIVLAMFPIISAIVFRNWFF